MNHVFKLVWSRRLGMLVPVAEGLSIVGRGGRTLTRRSQRRRALRLLARAGLGVGSLASLATTLFPVSALALPPVGALPQDGVVTAGTAAISSSGQTLTVLQSSSKAVINWQSFDIGSAATVKFVQPSASSVALNRVLGDSASQIFGHLTANGQIFLVNPNGVYFAPGAQVDVGGLVASTLGISDSDFLAGRYHFTGPGTASVVSYAEIQTFSGGYVAFISRVVDNEGRIVTPGGATALGAGGAVDLTLANDQLVSYQVPLAALGAAVTNGGAIVAQNGTVLLTARAKDALLRTVVNNSGNILATGASTHGGVVTLLGGASGAVADSGTISVDSAEGVGGTITLTGANVAVSGTAVLSARGQTGGGVIAVGGGVHGAGGAQALTTSVASGTLIDASATGVGAGGTVSVWSDVSNPGSRTQVSGTILAAGAGGGAGGFVETSGHVLSLTGAGVNTGGGTWLLDPYNVVIAASGASGTAYSGGANYAPGSDSTILDTTIQNALASNNVTITTGSAGTSAGAITVDAPIAWSANNALTLNAAGNIVVNAPISASFSGTITQALLNLEYGQASANGAGASLTFNAPTTLPAGNTLAIQVGSSGGLTPYTVVTTQAGLQSLGANPTNLAGHWALGASFTATTNFTPIGSSNGPFTGVFNGLGQTISGLTIHKAGSSNVGLFGYVSGATIENVGLVNDSVTGGSNTGGLVGIAFHSTITDAYATGAVSGTTNVGGLVGSASNSKITNAYATSAVSGSVDIGGLVGSTFNTTITDAYVTGAVSGQYYVGGLVGVDSYSTITDAYATGAVSSQDYVGGLVGDAYNSTITDAYATGAVSGQKDVGGLVGVANNSKITDAYATGAVSGSTNVGGLVGVASNSTITNTYWDTTTSGLSVGVGGGSAIGVTGLTTAQLAAALPTGFSSTVWANANNQTTPFLIANEGFGTVSGAVILGSDTGATPTHYGVIASQTQLQNIPTTGLGGAYVLGANLVATGNFTPIGSSSGPFRGVFNGLGQTITGLTIQKAGTSYVGLFGDVSGATIENIGLVNDSVTGGTNTGGLVGQAGNSTITNAYATGAVSGSSEVGGLVGHASNSTITDAYATGAVSGLNAVGGLVGFAKSSTITDAYATGAVSGYNEVGGLVGSNFKNTITDAYATGAVSGSGAVGGLLGDAGSSTITNAYWDTTTSGLSGGVGSGSATGVTGLTTAQLASALPTGFSSTVWANANNQTTPFLIANESFGTVSGAVILGSDTGATPTHYGVIASQTQLQNIPTTGLGGAYVLGANLVATGNFTPIGSSSAPFTGVFNGLGQTITGLTIQKAGTRDVGLFGYVSGATIEHIGLVNDSVTGGTNTGGLVGFASHSTITDAYATGAVSGTGIVGGLVGQASNSTITDAYATGAVSGYNAVGGLVGFASNSTITNAYATGAVSGQDYVGGLVGPNYDSTITNAYATGAVSGQDFVGGLVGQATNSAITDAYATGAVSGTSKVGGFMGFANVSTITDAYATGAVSGTSKVGGLVGYATNSEITDAYATGAVSGSSNVGGLVGGASYSTITNTYWDTTTSGLSGGVDGGSATGVTGLTTAQLASALPTGFSSTVWANANNQTTPFLIANESFGTVSGAVILGSDTGATPTHYGVIASQTQLQNIPTTGLGGAYVLGANLVATGNFTPIGSSNGPFTGVFNGLGQTITGLTIQKAGSSNVGLFGYVSGATIENVGLVNDSVTGGLNTGGLVGFASHSTITDAYATGAVSGQYYVGGLVGQASNSPITDAYATGAVSGQDYVGGFVGFAFSSTITHAYATGAVSGQGDVGGFEGFATGSTITDAYATGAVSGSGAVGGLVGFATNSKITDAYATGAVSGTYEVGGLVGSNLGSAITDAYWDTTTSGLSVGVGAGSATGVTGLTTAQLASALPTGFSSTVWANANNQTTPFLIANESFGTVSGAVILGSDTGATPTHYGVIASQTQLQNIPTTGLGGAYVLGANLVATGNFTPIGSSSAPFTGVFNGLGQTISGLTIQKAGSSNVGLFGYVSGATIENVGLVNDSVTGGPNTGGLVGLASHSTITDAYATGAVSGKDYVGGLLGGADNSTITDAYATGPVSGQYYVGGLVGLASNNSTITDAYATGAVSGTYAVGGLVGYASNSKITDAYATGAVSGTNAVGGLVGFASNSTITNAYATGAVSGQYYVGGLVGSNFGSPITDAYWDTTTSGLSGGVGSGSATGVTGLTTPQLASALPTGFSSTVWANANNQTTPFLIANEGFGTVSGAVILGSDTGATPTHYGVIASQTQLQNIPTTGLGGAYVLGANLVATGNFTPIGSRSAPFTGVFNGLGQTITGLTIQKAGSSNVGLFGYAAGATIENIGLVNDSVTGGTNTGGLVGVASHSTITDVYATGAVSGRAIVGGLVGQASNSTITDAYATGAVSGTGGVGGLVGFASFSTITNAYATGAVSGQDYVGGLVGSNSNSTITNAYATGAVSGTSKVGGLVGSNYVSTITDAYATGAVSGTSKVGGLVGYATNSKITDAYATGAVSGSSNVGGLVGGASYSTITNTYWDTTTSGLSVGVGGGSATGVTGLTTAQLAAALPMGFSSTVWANANNQTTPFLIANEGFGTVSGAVILGSDTGATPTPYGVIASQTQLQNIPTTGLGGAYALGANLVATGNFTPIGSRSAPFTGVFNGLGQTITGLTIQKAGSSNVGLFGDVSGATIENIGLVNDSVTGGRNTGGLVGFASNSTITDAYATGAVSGTAIVGGLVGQASNSTITNAYATGAVSGQYYVGGLVGVATNSTITDAYATGAVAGTYSVGGLVGYASNSTIANAYTTGAVSGSSNVGGLVGGANKSTITDAYATGAVSGSSNVGGLVGGAYKSTITDAYATGAVSGSSNIGGLAGNASNSTITNAYWDTTTSGLSVGVGGGSATGVTGLTTAQLASALPTGFSSTVWANANNQTTPFLIANESFGTVSGAVILGSDTGATPTHYGVIASQTQLQNIPTTGLGGAYVLGANLVATGNFTPIGSSSAPFTGVFNGLGQTITGLTIQKAGTRDVGLFGDVSGATIENIGLVNDSVTGGTNTGGLVGFASHSTITDAYATGAVSGSSNIGGLVGHASNSTITEAYATGAVSGTSNIGGLVGQASNSTITDAYATGAVSGTTNVGGLVGHAGGSTITDAYATGAVSGTSRVGGLVGSTLISTITDAYATGAVSGQNSVGGLVGLAGGGGTITDAYATGAVSGSTFVGGLVGGASYSTITNAYATGAVSGTSKVGGLVGGATNSTIITDAYATGAVSGMAAVGGLVGSNLGSTITNAYWDTTTSGLSVGVGVGLATGVTGLTTAQLASALPTGFSSTVWANANNQTTPFLLANEGFGTVSGAVILGSDTGATPTPYGVIASQTQLQNIPTTGLGGAYVLGANLVATGNFTPIGSNSAPFTGVFNGLGQTITGLTIQKAGSSNVGLFGYVSGATIENIGLVNDSVTGGSNTGGLVGFAGNSKITDAYATGAVSGHYFVGGLVGYASNSTITDAYARGAVSGQYYYVGGLVGVASNSTITDAYATGAVSGSGAVGGLVGFASNSTITNAYATGAVSGQNYVGGLVGGANKSTITDAYATGAVSGSSNIGGLAGNASNSTITNAYWDTTTSGLSVGVGGGSATGVTGLTTAQLASALPTGFSSTVWANANNQTTPFLIANESFGTVSGAVILGSDTGATPTHYGVIASQTQLQNIPTTGLGGAYVLGANLVATGNFTPIGSSSAPFTGVFNGLGQTITGLTIQKAGTRDVGLFGDVSGATIENIGLVNDSVTGGTNTGGLVGFASHSTITDAYATGAVSGSSSGSSNIGGLVGHASNSTITEAYATGAVSGTYEVGGLVGYASNSTITDAYATGAVSGSGAVGGLVGFASNSTITNAYATGAVSGYDLVGGLVGSNSLSTITDAYATGAVSGTSKVGGLVGSNYFSTITNAYATGAVSGTAEVGGLVGLNYFSTITDAYATGAVSGSSNIGGLVGVASNSTITNTYWDTTTSGLSVGVGAGSATGVTGLTTAQLAAALPTGFTSTVWANANNQTTPFLIANEGFGTVSGAVILGSDTGATPTPYGVIASQTQFQNILTTGLGGAYVLGANLVATGNFTPIGSSNAPFTGVFNGLGQTITGLTIQKAGTSHVGLFGYVSGATIENIGLVNDSVTGGTNTGGLVGTAFNSTIADAYATGAVSGTGRAVGGLVGYASNSTITNAYATGAVSGQYYVGGLVGSNVHSTITDAYATGAVSGTTNVGGLVGSAFSSTITHAYATGAVSGQDYVGGLVGVASISTITNAYATGAVSGTTNVGGLVGYANTNSAIIDAYATGAVSGSSNVGGLVGLASNNSTITNAYATGAVSGQDYVGGLVGIANNSTITDAYATGAVSGTYEVGGLVGGAYNSTITDAYATGVVSGQYYVGGLVGYASNNSTITDAYATGAVSGQYYVGGLVGGASYSTITDAYATGAVSGSSNVGGLVGSNYFSAITNAYWDTTTSGLSVGVGGGSATGVTGLTTAQLASALPTGFSSTVWANANNQTTPFLIANESFSTVSGAVILGSDTGATPTPYGVIASQTQLQNIPTTGLGGAYVLGANLVATGNFTPIGSNSAPFTGVFNGLGQTITGLTIQNAGSSNVGLFGDVSGATIENIGLVNDSVTGGRNTGGLVGFASHSTITDAYATGAVSGTAIVGGLVGQASNSTITDAYATGAVSGTAGVGGLVGSASNSTITNAYATGAVSGSSNIGGFVGGANGSTITNAYATGAVSGTLGVGGLVGFASNSTITNAYATGAVSGQYYVGGLVGQASNSPITDAYATGAVSGQDLVGGLVGLASHSRITDAYATGAVSGTTNFGGLAGNASNSTITNAYWDTTTSGLSVGVGAGSPTGVTGLTTVQWLTQGPIATGAFSSTAWVTGYPYPVLKALPYVVVSFSASQTYGSNAGAATVQSVLDQNGANAAAKVNVAGLTVLSSTTTLSNVSSTPFLAGGSGVVEAAGVSGEQIAYVGSVTVSARPVTISGLSGTNKTYDATTSDPLTGTATLNGLVAGQTLTLTNTGTGTLASANAGSEGVTTAITLANGTGANGGLAANYVLTQPTLAAVTVSPAPVTVTGLTGTNKTYDATTSDPLSGTATIDGLVAGQTLTLANAATGTLASANAGSEGVTTSIALANGTGANGGLAANYVLTSQPTLAAVTVSPAPVTITGLSGTNKVYDATTSDPLSGTATIDGLVAGQTLTLANATTGTLASANAGSEGVTTSIALANGANGGLAANYVLTSQPTLAAVTVSPAPVTVTGLTGTNKTYDATTSDPLSGTATLNGLVAGQTLTLANATTGTLASANAGSEGVTTSIALANGANGGLAANYVLTSQPTLAAVTVSPAPVTVTGLTGTNKTYDATTSDPLSGTATLNGLVAGQTLTLANATTGTLASANAGSEGVTTSIALANGANGGLAANYVLTSQPTLAAVTVSPAPVTITGLSGTNKVYDATTSDPLSGTATIDGLVAGQTLTLANAATGTLTSPNAGSEGVTTAITLANGANGGLAANYVLTQPTLAAVTVSPAPVTITGLSGTNKVYDATTSDPLTGTATITGLVAGQTLTLANAATGTLTSPNAGSEGVTTAITLANGANGGLAANYVLTQPTLAAVTVSPAPVTITGLSGTNKVYDATTSDPLSGTATIDGLVAGQTLTLANATTGTLASANAGSEGVTTAIALANGTGANGGLAANYVLTSQPTLAAVTVSPAPVTVTGLTGSNKTYDATTSDPLSGTATIDGLVAGQTLTLANATTGILASANAGSEGVTTSIALANGANGGLAANYVLTSQPTLAAVTVSPAPVTITGLSGTNKVYDATTSDPLSGTATIDGLVAGQTLTLANAATGTLASANAGSEGVTTAITLANGTGLAANYVLTSQPTLAAVTVSPAPVTVTGLTGTNKTYDATTSDPLSGTATIDGLVAGQTLTLANAATGTLASANAGSEGVTTAITLANGTGLAANYVLTQPTLAAVTVSPAPVTITGLSGTNKVYDATTSDPLTGTPTITGLVASQTLTLANATTGTLASANAGSEGVTTAIALANGTGANGGLAANYVLTQPTLAAVTVSPAPVTVTGLTGTNKTYDATTSDPLSETATLNGLVAGQTLTLANATTGTLASANAGSEGVTTAITLANGTGANGGLAANYVLISQPTLAAVTVSPAPVTITGLSGTNKVYDATTSDPLSGTATIDGLVAGQTLTLANATTGTLASANAGSEGVTTAIALANGANGGLAANYVLTQPTLAAVTVSPAPVTITGLSGTNKVYDATTSDPLSGTATIDGLVAGQTLTLANAATGTLASANAGSEGVTTSIALANGANGGLAANYVLTQPTLAAVTVSPAPVTITGLSGTNKVYDATTSDPLSGTATLNGLVAGQTLTLANATTGTLTSPNAGSEGVTTAITLANGANGGLAANYVLTQPTLAAVTVSPAPVTITGLSGTNKVYDATTSDPLSGTATIDGLVAGQTLTLTNTGTGTLASANAGSEGVTTAIALADGANGGLAANYVLTQPALAAVTVSPAPVTVTGLTGTNKVYDGTTNDPLAGTATIIGLVASQTLTLTNTATGTLASANPGVEAVTTDIALANGTGPNAGLAANYVLTQPTLAAVTVSPAASGTGTATGTGTESSSTLQVIGYVEQQDAQTTTTILSPGGQGGFGPSGCGSYTAQCHFTISVKSDVVRPAP